MNNLPYNTLTHSLTAGRIVYRKLTEKDALSYKRLRTLALTGEDYHFFTTDKKKELSFSLTDWQNSCREKIDADNRGKYVAVGAFKGIELVGSSLVERWAEDKTDYTAFYKSIYVRPSFRKMGIGEQIELYLDEWSRINKYTKAVFTIHADNEKWIQQQIRKLQATVIDKKTAVFADGNQAAIYVLERPLTSILGTQHLPMHKAA